MEREIFPETKQFVLTQALLDNVRNVAANLPDEQAIVDLAAWEYPLGGRPGRYRGRAKPAPQEWVAMTQQLTQQQRRELRRILGAVVYAREKPSYSLTPEQKKAIEEYGNLSEINTVRDLRVASEKGVLVALVGMSEKSQSFLRLAFKQVSSTEDKTP